jgi:hypothetical protein
MLFRSPLLYWIYISRENIVRGKDGRVLQVFLDQYSKKVYYLSVFFSLPFILSSSDIYYIMGFNTPLYTPL